jgi:hypothetical protein
MFIENNEIAIISIMDEEMDHNSPLLRYIIITLMILELHQVREQRPQLCRAILQFIVFIRCQNILRHLYVGKF